jgi:ATP-dependent Lon protease
MCGKTTLALKIAELLGRKIFRIDAATITDVSDIIGKIGKPGFITRAMHDLKVSNPIILIENIGCLDYGVDTQPCVRAIIDLSDAALNKNFIDNSLGVQFDISKIIFIFTDSGHYADVKIESISNCFSEEYSSRESKDAIVKRFILPKIVKRYDLPSDYFKFDAKSYKRILEYNDDTNMTVFLRNDLRKLTMYKIHKYGKISKLITSKTLDEAKLFQTSTNILASVDQSGVVHSLCVSGGVGKVSKHEVIKMMGSGQARIVGGSDQDIKNSFDNSWGYICSKAKEFEIEEAIQCNDVQLSFSSYDGQGGASSGVTMVTAFLSCLRNIKISSNIAMTGCISVTGEILPIGGLKQKLLAAVKEGKKKVFIPRANENEFKNIKNSYLKGIEVLLVKNYQEIYESLFTSSKIDKKDEPFTKSEVHRIECMIREKHNIFSKELVLKTKAFSTKYSETLFIEYLYNNDIFIDMLEIFFTFIDRFYIRWNINGKDDKAKKIKQALTEITESVISKTKKDLNIKDCKDEKFT